MVWKLEVRHGMYESTVQIHAPALYPLNGFGPTAFIMSSRRDITHNVHRFSVNVVLGPGSRRKKFEWRPIQGREIHEMFENATGYLQARSFGNRQRPGWQKEVEGI
ncbi:hypothetical protein GGR54DRAFT_511700 [Hypoxylon sp. NC1633]|nr:hypothetical protein GGR54DRAFT_511700 [Hypoxylon sp. NC1633]